MVRKIMTGPASAFSLLIALFAAFISAPSEASLTATVDRTTLALYETLELTLRTDSDSATAPDLSPLENDFDLLGTRQSRQVRIINGRTESWRDWVVTLSPKRKGYITLPALTLNGMTSQPIKLEVYDNNSNSSSVSNISPVFIRATLDNESVYVQEEVVLSLQIYYRVDLYDDRRITPLNIDGAIVQQLGDTNNYETIVNGTRYGVFELKFSIHPQKTGDITIPSVTFSGTMADRRDNFGGIFSMGGKPIVVRSPEIQLNVIPQPESYTGSVWLPSRKLTLTDGWSGPTNQLKVGDAITRTIVVNAEGLTSAQLPAIRMSQPEGVNVYPDKSSTDDQVSEAGVTGTRIEAIAIIPTQVGTVTLPPIRYTWFDTTTNTERVAEIPAKTLEVVSAPGNTAVIATPTPGPKEIQSDNKDCPKATTLPDGSDRDLTLWKLIAGVFALLWLLTAISFWGFYHRKKKSSVISKEEAPGKFVSPSTEKATFKQLEGACARNDLAGIRSHFILWMQALYQDNSLTSLEKCLKVYNSDALNELFMQLEKALFSQQQQEFDSSSLLKLCRKLRKQKGDNGQSKGSSGFRELYPS